MGIGQSYLLIVLIILLLSNNISSAEIPVADIQKLAHQMSLYHVAKKIEINGAKYHLEYKDFPDLVETCSIVDKYSKFDKVFTKEDVLSIILRESRFNKDAHNRNDGGAGLGQLTGIKIWWKNELFWLKNPYDKDQNIKGMFVVLNSFHRQYGNKYQALKHYNGSTKKSDRYAKDVLKIRKDIFSI
jgi:hypothetical protein